ncbi:hypothetical protein [Salinarimonas sp.]|uniref:hypothetical protein n=1 Tax=Salinarimonas sp. TaxID=2766526 RepID=UPI003918F234
MKQITATFKPQLINVHENISADLIDVTPEVIAWAQAALPAARKEAADARHMADSAFLTRGAGQTALWHNAEILKWRVRELEMLAEGRNQCGLHGFIGPNEWERLTAFVGGLLAAA